MRRAVIAVVLFAALAAAPAAAAKEITSAKVCGVDGCVTTRDPTLLQGLMGGGGLGVAPRPPARAIEVRARVSEPGGKVIGRFSNWWVPGTELMVGEDGIWMMLPRDAVAVLAKLSHDLQPFPPGRLESMFAGTSSHAAAPPPTTSRTTGGDVEGGVDWLLVGGLCALAVVAATGLTLLRRRPGGATP
jgi:hypothetical protein